MDTSRIPIGASAILRLASCPIRSWLAGASPDLFASAAQLNEIADQYTALSAQLAVRLGEELVPHTALSRADRRRVLNVRRTLHAGVPLPASELAAIAEIVRRTAPPTGDALADAVDRVAELSRELLTLEPLVVSSIAGEEERIARIALDLVQELPVLGALVRDRNAELYAALVRARPEGPLRGKMLRRNGAYIWEILDRAALNSTPRDWHSHVALLHVGPETPVSSSIALTERVGTAWCENLHTQRRELAALPLEALDASLRLAPAPIHFTRDDRLCFWVVNHERHAAPMVEVEMRRTPTLEEVHRRLAAGPRTMAELQAELVPGGGADQRELLRGFVEYLVQQGTIEVSAPLREETVRWRPLAAAIDEPRRTGGFLDVYREAAGPVALATCRRIEDRVVQALRVLAAIDDDRYRETTDRSSAEAPHQDEVPDESPRPLLDLVAERLERLTTSTAASERPAAQDWPTPTRPDSAYAHLLGHLAACTDEAMDLAPTSLDIDASLFRNRLGAPGTPLDWPIDCLVRVPRPGCGLEAVLEDVFPAGALDARFATTLEDLHGCVPHVAAYGRFLRLVEEASGVSFLELLVPPLSTGAANAVRRPIYTTAWTGNPDLGSYARMPNTAMRYVPLDAISMRRRHGRLRAEVNGSPICPMYHATRIPLAPWNLVADLLLGAAPLPMRWSSRRLHRSLDAFPDRDYLPRITVARDLVLTGRQWRLRRAAMWSASASPAAKVRAVARLRRERDWPRWVLLSPASGSKPRPCDLDCIRSIRALEQAWETPGADLIVIEMIPAPDELLVDDRANSPGGAVASAIMLRLPCDTSPAELAARVAPAFERWSR